MGGLAQTSSSGPAPDRWREVAGGEPLTNALRKATEKQSTEELIRSAGGHLARAAVGSAIGAVAPGPGTRSEKALVGALAVVGGRKLFSTVEGAAAMSKLSELLGTKSLTRDALGQITRSAIFQNKDNKK